MSKIGGYRWLLFCLSCCFFMACQQASESSNKRSSNLYRKSVNVCLVGDSAVYQPIFDLFEQETGIKVVTFSIDIWEESNIIGDVLLSDEVAVLIGAKQEGLLTPVETDRIDEHSPLAYRDQAYHWFGLGQMLQVLVYNPALVDTAILSEYFDLGGEEWKGKLALTNWEDKLTWIAAMLANRGIEKTASWLEQLNSNQPTAPITENTAIELVANGSAGGTVVSSATILAYLNSHTISSDQLSIFIPNQKTTGVHSNLLAAGLIANTANKEEAIELLTFLTGATAQEMLAKQFFYPTNPAVEAEIELPSLDILLLDPLDPSFLYQNRAMAKEILSKYIKVPHSVLE